MTKKKGKVKKVIRQAGSNISKREMNRIVKAAGGNVTKAINRIASVQQSMKSADKQAPRVASGAANMLIKQAEKAPAFRQPDFGTSKLGQTLQSMVARPGTPGVMRQGQRVGGTPAQPGFNPGGRPDKNRMIGGTYIKAGGGITSRRRAQPTVTDAGDTTLDTSTTPTGLSADDVRGILDEYLSGLGLGGQQQEYDPMADLMSNIGSMFSSAMGGYQQSLSDQMALMNQFAAPQEPTRLYGAGQNYNIDAIRAAQRNQQRRTGYMRGGMGIGGQSGVTTGAPTSGLNIGSALGILGGVTG